ncbi:MAG: alpha/beta fold hydrolase [Pirellulaceae bacterium]
MMSYYGLIIAAITCGLCMDHLLAQDTALTNATQDGSLGRFRAQDTLVLREDPRADATDCLAGLRWQPTDFEVHVEPDKATDRILKVRFASPRPSGVSLADRVAVEWHPAKDAQSGAILKRPAVIVVHESGSSMNVGRLIASDLGRRGIHAFMVQLPGYGDRKANDFRPDDLVGVFKQGVADVRRARDAVAAIPQVDSRHIGLQGTSLGGFVASLSGSLDGSFDSVFLLLCGGNLHGVLTSGSKDARKALERLIASGVAANEVHQALQAVEPLRIAHRLDAQKTWLYTGTFDDVVPPKYSKELAEAIDLPRERHVQMLATHYSGVIFLPGVLEKIVQVVEQ